MPPATVAIQVLKLRMNVFDTLQELVDSFLEMFYSVSAEETNARVNLRKQFDNFSNILWRTLISEAAAKDDCWGQEN